MSSFRMQELPPRFTKIIASRMRKRRDLRLTPIASVVGALVAVVGSLATMAAVFVCAGVAEAQDVKPADVKPQDWPRERLVRLLRELADEAFDLFVVTDEHRRVYGMAYEFVRDGRHVQDFGLDSMHDGAWLLSALVTAHRIDPEGGYLERAQRFQIPFYVNLLTNSDWLFPKMIPREDQEKFDKPIKGWAPRGWDDGPGIDLVAGKPFSTGVVSHGNGTVVERDANGKFQQAYFTSSHHLLQDLADTLLNVWLTTRDPDVASAILLIHENRVKYGYRIPVVQKAAGLTNGVQQLYARPREPHFDPAQGLRPLWQGLVERQAIMSGRYDDGLAWTYDEECARAALSGDTIAAGFVANAVGRVYAQTLATEAFFGPQHYRHGFTLDTRGVEFEKDTGRLARRYEGNTMLFTRGIQYAWIAAALLPEFKARPEAWDAGIRQLEADGSLSRLRTGAESFSLEFRSEPDRIVSYLDNYNVGTIDYWAGVRKKLGYLPRGYYPDGRNASWVRMPELGAYAHMMKLVAFRLMAQQGVTEWELIQKQAPQRPIPHMPLPETVLKIQGRN